MAKQKINSSQIVSSVLGTATMVSSSSTFTTTATTLITLNITITQSIFDSGRKFKLSAFLPQVYSSVAGDRTQVSIREGATRLTTVYHASGLGASGATEVNIQTPAMTMPSVGNHTYTLVAFRDSGTGNIIAYADADSFGYLEAEIK